MRLIDAVDLRGKRVFIRVDFNVPLSDGKVADATRIDASLPTIRYAREQAGRGVLASQLGRPKGKATPALSLAPVRAALADHLGVAVRMAPDCVGAPTEALVNALGDGDVLLLENLRFHAEEEQNDEQFS